MKIFLRLCLLPVLVFFVVSVLVPQYVRGSSSVEMDGVRDPIKKAEIAKRVEAELRHAEFIEVTSTNSRVIIGKDGVTSGKPEVVTVVRADTKGAFRALIFNEKKDLVLALSLFKGIEQEYQPGKDIFQYKSPYIGGSAEVRSGSSIDCLIGEHTYAWASVPFPNDLPDDCDFALMLRNKIESAVREPDAVERGHDCYVFKEEFPVEDGVIQHVTFFDKKTYLLVRWDSSWPTYRYSRLYEITVKDEVPRNFDWKLDLLKKEQDQVAKK